MRWKASLREGKSSTSFFFLLLYCISYGSTAPLLPSTMHSLALRAIDLMYNERYKEAEEEALNIIKNHPTHPAGYFFMGVAIDSWMAAHASDKREDEFYRFCELTIEKGEKLITKNPNDEWALFFIGGAEGYKGTYEARYERWIAAFKYGWKGVSTLLKLKERNSAIPDINYGIGSYEYWRSSLMKSLWWMPGVEDKRSIGIEKLLKSRTEGTFTKEASSASLIDIYLNDKNYAAALDIADESLRQYPLSRLFAFGKARSLFGLSRFDESEAVYREILSRMDDNPNENRASIALCHLGMAQIKFANDLLAECIKECDLMKSYLFDDDRKKAMEKYFTEVDEIKKSAMAARKHNNGVEKKSQK